MVVITNRVNYAELPATGGPGPGCIRGAGALLALGAAALLLRRKRRAGAV